MIRRASLLLLLALAACREGPAEYELVLPDTLSDVGGRLTYNVLDDHAPTFNGTSDSVLYSAEGYPPFPLTKGFLLTMSKRGGKARALVDVVQIGLSRPVWLQAPVLSPNRSRIAFVEVTDTVQRLEGIVCPGGIELFTEPVLLRGSLRVRAAQGVAPDEASVPIVFEGVRPDSTQHPFGLEFITIEVSHPYHRQFQRYRLPVFRPTWSPDGTRIAFSDGLNIRIWTVGQPTSVVVPNTADGISPAWSPDGTRIAFTRLARGTVREYACAIVSRGQIVAVFERYVYGTSERAGNLVVVNVDGSQPRDLGEGYAPAWMPNSQQIVATRAGNLYRIPADGSAATVIPETALGFEPGISPDGNWLAFTRDVAEQTPKSDIWVVPLR